MTRIAGETVAETVTRTHSKSTRASVRRSVVEILREETSGGWTRIRERMLPGSRRLTSTEARRRLWHILPGFIPFVVIWAHPDPGTVSFPARAVLAAVAVGITLYVLHVYHTIAREGERNQIVNLVSYWAGMLALLLLFPRQPELAVAVLVIQSFGDGAATMFGLMFGRRRLPTNREKTWIGSLAFLVCSAPAASLIYLLWASPPVSIGIAAVCGGSAALCSALVESLPSKISDNLRVNVVASLVVVTSHSILVGWGV